LKWLFNKLYRLLHALYPIIASITVTLITAYIYSIGPYAPPGAEISYNVENYIHEPDGSYMQAICVWNSGSKDIPNLNLLYSFESYISNEVLDKDFSILDRLPNASPLIGAGSVSKVNNATYLAKINYSLLPINAHFREQFYINKPYPITVKSMTPDVVLKPGTTPCDPCTC
jgi:hypothetical protein